MPEAKGEVCGGCGKTWGQATMTYHGDKDMSFCPECEALDKQGYRACSRCGRAVREVELWSAGTERHLCQACAQSIMVAEKSG